MRGTQAARARRSGVGGLPKRRRPTGCREIVSRSRKTGKENGSGWQNKKMGRFWPPYSITSACKISSSRRQLTRRTNFRIRRSFRRSAFSRTSKTRRPPAFFHKAESRSQRFRDCIISFVSCITLNPINEMTEACQDRKRKSRNFVIIYDFFFLRFRSIVSSARSKNSGIFLSPSSHRETVFGATLRSAASSLCVSSKLSRQIFKSSFSIRQHSTNGLIILQII